MNEITNPAEQLAAWLTALEARVASLEKGLTTLPLPTKTEPVKPLLQYDNVNLDITISGQDKLAAAIVMTRPGGIINVWPGNYNDAAIIKVPLTIAGKSRLTTSFSNKTYNDKAVFVIAARDVSIRDLEIFNVRSSSGNGCAVRISENGGNLTLDNLYVHNCQMGVLGKLDDDSDDAPGESVDAGFVHIKNSRFENFKSGSAHAHAIYIVFADEFSLDNCTVTGAIDGHLVKTGAKKISITNNVIAILESKSGRCFDLFAGNDVLIKGNVIQGSDKADNSHFINYGGEQARMGKGPHRLIIEDNLFIVDEPMIPNQTATRPPHQRQWNIIRPMEEFFTGEYEIIFKDNVVIGPADFEGFYC